MLNWTDNCKNYAKLILAKIEILPNVNGMAINADIRQCAWMFNGSNYANVLHWSDKALAKQELKNSTKVVSGDYVEEHAVPVKFICQAILSLENPTVEEIQDILINFASPTIITKEEDGRLKDAKLNTKMPADWDGKDHYARYTQVGINVVENPNGRK